MGDLTQIEQAANGQRDYPPLVISPNLDPYREEADDEIELRDLFTALKRRWQPWLGVTAVTFVGLLTWYVSRPPVYERSFAMAVEPLERLTGSDPGASSLLGAIPGGVVPSMGLGSLGGADYSSLITVLQSELVLQPVVQAAQGLDPELDYSTFLESLTVEQSEGSKILDISFRSKDPELVQQVTAELQAAYLTYSTDTQQMAMVRRLNDLNTQVETQRQVVARTQASLVQFQEENQILDLKSASEALEQRRSEVLTEQQNTRLTLNATLEKYDNLKNQLGLQPAEAVLVANLSESPVYQKLLAEYRDLESQVALESARFREDTPIIQALRDKQNQLRPLLQAEAERNVGASLAAMATVSPQTLSYQGSVGRGLVSQLVTAVNDIQMLEVQDQSLSQIYQALSSELDNLVSLSSGFREIERNLTLSEAALQRLLTAQQELKLQLEAQTNPWVIVSGYDLTTPLEPESRLLRGLVLSFVASGVLGLGTVFLLEMLDRSYHSAEQASESSQLPILGTVPWVRQLPALVPLPYVGGVPTTAGALPFPNDSKPQRSESPASPSIFATAFQTLDANLRLLGGNTTLQIVAISSCDAMEGKTTVAAHLAVASARSGRKVLLVDCDLREPALGQWFGLKSPVPNPGAFLPSEAIMPEIQPVLDDGTLDVLQCANTHAMAPAGFLASAQFELFLKQCRSHYDLILLDTPTTLNAAETKIVSQYVDGLLVVLKLGQTDRELVNGALKDFRTASKTPILGLVANGVEAR